MLCSIHIWFGYGTATTNITTSIHSLGSCSPIGCFSKIIGFHAGGNIYTYTYIEPTNDFILIHHVACAYRFADHAIYLNTQTYSHAFIQLDTASES